MYQEAILNNIYIGFLFSVIFNLIILFFKRFHSKYTLDNRKGPQNINEKAIPRIGGLAVILGLICLNFLTDFSENLLMWKLIIVCFPAFIAGFVEDCMFSVSPIIRLMSSLITGIMFILIFQHTITHVQISTFDYLLNFKVFSIIITIVSIALLIQSYNIIDGLNGLASGCCILTMISISIMSYFIDDKEIFMISISFLFILIGFFIFNFPYGKIFLGDGGAYLLGACTAVIIILLSERNQGISPFAVLNIVLWPIYETLRSFVRRLLNNKNSIFQPDTFHLHSLIHKKNTNNFSSSLILFFHFFCCVWSIYFLNNKTFLIFGLCIFVLVYEILYKFHQKKL